MPPALSGLIPTMGPDAAGGNWSRGLRPLPAGKKSLSKFGPTSPPKKLLLATFTADVYQQVSASIPN